MARAHIKYRPVILLVYKRESQRQAIPSVQNNIHANLCLYDKASRKLLEVMLTTYEMFKIYENGKCKENEQDEVWDDEYWGYWNWKLQENREQSR